MTSQGTKPEWNIFLCCDTLLSFMGEMWKMLPKGRILQSHVFPQLSITRGPPEEKNHLDFPDLNSGKSGDIHYINKRGNKVENVSNQECPGEMRLKVSSSWSLPQMPHCIKAPSTCNISCVLPSFVSLDLTAL